MLPSTHRRPHQECIGLDGSGWFTLVLPEPNSLDTARAKASRATTIRDLFEQRDGSVPRALPADAGVHVFGSGAIVYCVPLGLAGMLAHPVRNAERWRTCALKQHYMRFENRVSHPSRFAWVVYFHGLHPRRAISDNRSRKSLASHTVPPSDFWHIVVTTLRHIRDVCVCVRTHPLLG